MPIILIINNALIKMLVASVFQIFGNVTKCKLYFHHHVHFIFSRDLNILGEFVRYTPFFSIFEKPSNDPVLCSSAISTPVEL